MTGAFEVLSVDPAQKRIGIALVEEGSARAADADAAPPDTAASSPSLGSLAERLRNALKDR
jgi:hypothetical protein